MPLPARRIDTMHGFFACNHGRLKGGQWRRDGNGLSGQVARGFVHQQLADLFGQSAEGIGTGLNGPQIAQLVLHQGVGDDGEVGKSLGVISCSVPNSNDC